MINPTLTKSNQNSVLWGIATTTLIALTSFATHLKHQGTKMDSKQEDQKIIKGEFDVQITPASSEEPTDPQLGVMKLDKTYHGKLEAQGKGHMLTGMTAKPGSAVYVAIEKITGKLDGKDGSFMIHHRGIMDENGKQLEVFVVPNSGTGELVGLSGSMSIDIRDGKHFYEFKYQFPK